MSEIHRDDRVAQPLVTDQAASHVVSSTHSGQNEAIAQVAGGVIGKEADGAPNILQGRVKKELTPPTKGFLEWLFSCLFGWKDDPVKQLIKSFAEYKEVPMQEFVQNLYSKAYGSIKEDSRDISTYVRGHFAEIQEILGPEKTKQFIFLLSRQNQADDQVRKWASFIIEKYGEQGNIDLTCSYFVQVFSDEVSSCVQEWLEKIPPPDETDMTRAMVASLRKILLLLKKEKDRSKISSKQLCESMSAKLLEVINKKNEDMTKLLSVRAAVKRLADDSGLVDDLTPEEDDELQKKVKMDQTVVSYLQKLNLFFENIQQVPTNLQEPKQGIWDVGASYKDDKSTRNDWENVLAKKNNNTKLDELISPGYYEDCHRAEYCVSGRKIVGDSRHKEQRIKEVNKEFCEFIAKAFEGKNLSPSQVNLLRYQIQDIMYQKMFPINNELLPSMWQHYQADQIIPLDGKEISYSLTCQNGKVVIEAWHRTNVHKDPEWLSLGKDILQIRIEIDVNTYKPDQLLFEQDRGCVVGGYQRSGFQSVV